MATAQPNARVDSPDVVFVSYDEPNADSHFERLLTLAPYAKRVHGVRGIGAAYRAAAALSETPYVFIVDADNWVLDDFPFRFPDGESRADVYLWAARNAVNRISWFNGGVKLINVRAFDSLRMSSVDFFSALNGRKSISNDVASETRFNGSRFHAWRCGFRECAKLAGGVVRHPAAPELLEIWTTTGAENLNGRWCILGAAQGKAFGEKHYGLRKLRQINDQEWLKAEFAKCSADEAASGA